MIRGTVTEVKNGAAEGMSVLTVETTTDEIKKEGNGILFSVVEMTPMNKPVQKGEYGHDGIWKDNYRLVRIKSIPGSMETFNRSEILTVLEASSLAEKAFNAGRIGRKGRPGFISYEEWKQTQPLLNGK